MADIMHMQVVWYLYYIDH